MCTLKIERNDSIWLIIISTRWPFSEDQRIVKDSESNSTYWLFHRVINKLLEVISEGDKIRNIEKRPAEGHYKKKILKNWVHAVKKSNNPKRIKVKKLHFQHQFFVSTCGVHLFVISIWAVWKTATFPQTSEASEQRITISHTEQDNLFWHVLQFREHA